MVFRSLFLRMRLIHWVGIVLLLVSASLFTENPVGMAIQYFIALVVLIHDMDEKRWGVQSIHHVSGYLKNLHNRDLTIASDVNVSFNTEMGGMLEVIDEFREVIRQTIAEVKSIAASNEQTASALCGTADQVRNRINQGQTLLVDARSTVQNVDSRSSDLAESAAHTHTELTQALETLERIQGDFETIATSSQQTIDSSQTLNQEMERLSEGVNQVGQVLVTIGEVAEQTNLLALNAAIEAARAGDAGRGFAVVADEVRGLAQRTQTSLSQVGDVVRNITDSTSGVRNEVGQQASLLEGLADASRQSLSSIAAMHNQVKGMTGLAQETASTSEQIRTDMTDVSQNVENLFQHAEQSVEDMQQVNDMALQSNEIAGSLRSRLSEFTT